MRCDPTSLVALALRGGEDDNLDSRLRTSGMTRGAPNVGNDGEGHILRGGEGETKAA